MYALTISRYQTCAYKTDIARLNQLDFVFVAVRLNDVLEHVGDHPTDVFVGGRVEDSLTS